MTNAASLTTSPDRASDQDSDDKAEAAPSGRPAAPSEICRPAELARHLGLSTRSVYEYIRRKQLPGVRVIGRSVLIHLPTVLAWVADGQGGVTRSRRSKS